MTRPPQPPGDQDPDDYALHPPAPAPQPPAPPQQPPQPSPYAQPVPPPPPSPYAQPQQPQYPYGQQQPQPQQPPAQQPYGQPQPPQQQYPYGQQPQQPYAQPSPYGQQPPPPSGYGHPQQPPPGGHIPYDQRPTHPRGYGAQPPYGYPQFPPQGQAPAGDPPSGAGRKRSGGRLVALVAGAVALVLIVGGVVWFATRGASTPQAHHGGSTGATTGGTASGGTTTSADDATGTGTGSGQGGTPTADDGSGHTSTGRVRWTVKHAAVAKRDLSYDTPGMWFTGGHVVKQTPTGVAAYDAATGHTAWTAAVPSGFTCQAAQTVADHAVAVQYGTHCQDVAVVDTANGRVRWHKELPGAGSADTYTFEDLDLAVSGTTVALAWNEQSVAYSLTDGHQEWASSTGDSCQDTGFAGGVRMVEVYKCGYGLNAPYHVRLINPQTGKPSWSWAAPANTEIRNVVSVDPLVVGLGAGASGVTGLWDVEGGTLHGKVSLGADSDGSTHYGMHCPVTLTPCTGVLVADGTLYLTSHPNPGGQYGAAVNRVAAFDLATGQPKWLSKQAGQVLDLVAVDGDSLLTYRRAPLAGSGALVKVSRATGALTTYTTMSKATEQTEETAYLPSDFGLAEGWYRGTLYFGMTQVDSHNTLTPYLVAALR